MQSSATSTTARIIADNWRRVTTEVAEACEMAGRSHDVIIVGVSKYVGPELTQQLHAAGCRVLGENRPQSLWRKYEWFQLHQLDQPEWHMVGHLQRNKVRRSLPMIACLHSVDSLRLASALNEESLGIPKRLPVLVEVNVTQDPTKTGMPAEELTAFLAEAGPLPGIELRGLMAMSSLDSNSERARREFAQVRQLRDRLQEQFPNLQLAELSMGMSADFREAIAEGATLVRIGSNLWRGIEL